MKILFAGPTLHGEIAGGRLQGAPGLVCRGPARQGDIAEATLEGASAIGLVDGLYEDVAAPWHKEILFALAQGVAVFGGASLGALRAAECAAFGMIGIGEIFERYASGQLVDDSDVAQLHAPAELDYIPLTEALVNVEETFAFLIAAGQIDARMGAELGAIARALFFKALTFEAVIARAGLPDAEAALLLDLIARHRIDLKRRDAHLIVARLQALPDERNAPEVAWTLEEPKIWRRFIERCEASRRAPISSPADGARTSSRCE
jgi:hypothetical protein